MKRRMWLYLMLSLIHISEYVCIRTEYYTVHYFIHHYSAAYHCDSEAVSDTHLDVYKRQGQQGYRDLRWIIILQGALA